MKEHIRAGRNEEALKLAEQLEPAKIKSNSDLSILSDLYLESGMLAKAGDCLSELYSRKKTRSILMQLINLSVRIKKVEEAEKYYREFKAMAPDDFYNYIFRYSIDKIKGRNYETLIESLEKLKNTEYIDSWAYELAKLYHKAGRQDDCIRECDDIVTWFGDGEYVDRARALKAYYLGELSGMMDRVANERNAASMKENEDHAGNSGEETAEAYDGDMTEENAVETAAGYPEEVTEVSENETENVTENGPEYVTETAAEDEPDTGSGVSDETEREDDDLSDYEEDLKEFENEFNIKLADEVMAQIEGLDENRFEVEPVDISGVLNDEEYNDNSDADVKIAYDRHRHAYEPEKSRTDEAEAEPEVIEEEYTAEDLGDEEAVADEENGAEDTVFDEESGSVNENSAVEENNAGEDNLSDDESVYYEEHTAEYPGEAAELAETAEESASEERRAEYSSEDESGSEEGGSADEEFTGIKETPSANKGRAGSGRPVTGAELEAVLQTELEAALAAEAVEKLESKEPAEEQEFSQTAVPEEKFDAEAEKTGSGTGEPVNIEPETESEAGIEEQPENEETGSMTVDGIEEEEEEEEPEIVSHSFKALNNVKISEDSLTAAFLRNNDAELEDYFGFFAYQEDTRSQLIKTIEILLNPQIRNKCMVVSGERNSGSKTIIKGLTKILKESGFLKNPQIAFTEAEKINTMSLKNNVDRLIGCCLLINHAGRLSADSVRQLLDANSRFTGKTAVIMSDHRSEIKKLLKENRELNSMFAIRMHIPVYDAEDMEDLLFVRLNEKGYSIEKKAYENMQKELRKIVREVGEGSLAEADRYIEAVIDRLETRNAKKLLSDGFKGVSEKDRIVFVEDTVRKKV